MKRVFVIHGFRGNPNGAWRPWLVSELQKIGVRGCALSMPTPKKPILSEWIEEISRNIESNSEDSIYLVGHSLGVAAILNYAQSNLVKRPIAGAVLISGHYGKAPDNRGKGFYEGYDFKRIKEVLQKVTVIHGDNDERVSLEDGKEMAKEFGVELVVVPNGGHLNGKTRCFVLPECLEALKKAF